MFVFGSPQSPGRKVLIFDVNPFMTGAYFHPEAVDRLNVDNDGDTQADVFLIRVLRLERRHPDRDRVLRNRPPGSGA